MGLCRCTYLPHCILSVFVLQTEFYQHRGRNVIVRIDWWHLTDVNFAIPLGPVIFVLIPITVSSGVASAIVVGTGQICWPWLPVEVESSGCVSFFRRLVIRFIYSLSCPWIEPFRRIVLPQSRLTTSQCYLIFTTRHPKYTLRGSFNGRAFVRPLSLDNFPTNTFVLYDLTSSSFHWTGTWDKEETHTRKCNYIWCNYITIDLFITNLLFIYFIHPFSSSRLNIFIKKW